MRDRSPYVSTEHQHTNLVIAVKLLWYLFFGFIHDCPCAFVCMCVSLSLSLSLSHTHTHTHKLSLSLSLSLFLSIYACSTQQCQSNSFVMHSDSQWEGMSKCAANQINSVHLFSHNPTPNPNSDANQKNAKGPGSPLVYPYTSSNTENTRILTYCQVKRGDEAGKRNLVFLILIPVNSLL